MEPIKAYRAVITAEREVATKAAAQYEAQGCNDDAKLEKIKLNILGVFETVLNVDERQSDPDGAILAHFDTLTAPWRARLLQAQQHADADTEVVEQVKLAIADKLKDAYLAAKEA